MHMFTNADDIKGLNDIKRTQRTGSRNCETRLL